MFALGMGTVIKIGTLNGVTLGIDIRNAVAIKNAQSFDLKWNELENLKTEVRKVKVGIRLWRE